MIENQVGAYSESPNTIAQVVAGWLAPENVAELQTMSSRARALGRPEATFDIIRDLVGKSHASRDTFEGSNALRMDLSPATKRDRCLQTATDLSFSLVILARRSR